jgi:hypothetical protein
LTFIIEGFAASAEVMYPCVIDTDEGPDLTNEPSDAHGRHAKRSDCVIPWPLADQRRSNEEAAQSLPLTASGSCDRGAFRLVRLAWRKHLGGENKVPVLIPERLDDRMLRDIGLHRDEIESSARQMDPWGW